MVLEGWAELWNERDEGKWNPFPGNCTLGSHNAEPCFYLHIWRATGLTCRKLTLCQARWSDWHFLFLEMINLFRKSSVKKSLEVSFYISIDFLKIGLHFPFVRDWEVAIQRNSDPSALARALRGIVRGCPGRFLLYPTEWPSGFSSNLFAFHFLSSLFWAINTLRTIRLLSDTFIFALLLAFQSPAESDKQISHCHVS